MRTVCCKICCGNSDNNDEIDWPTVGRLLDFFFFLVFIGGQSALTFFFLLPLGTKYWKYFSVLCKFLLLCRDKVLALVVNMAITEHFKTRLTYLYSRLGGLSWTSKTISLPIYTPVNNIPTFTYYFAKQSFAEALAVSSLMLA